MSNFVWGTVTEASPLRVRLDGDTSALPFALDSLVDPSALAVDDRVRCELSRRRVIILGRSQGVAIPRAHAIGEVRSGLWSLATIPADTIALLGQTDVVIEDWPLLADLFETVFGTKNHFGGDGATTFGVPTAEQMVLIGQADSGISSVLGSTVGTLTHVHDLSDAGQAKVQIGTAGANWAQIGRVSAAPWTPTHRNGPTSSGVTGGTEAGTAAGLMGETEAGSSVQPGLVVRHVITGR